MGARRLEDLCYSALRQLAKEDEIYAYAGGISARGADRTGKRLVEILRKEGVLPPEGASSGPQGASSGPQGASSGSEGIQMLSINASDRVILERLRAATIVAITHDASSVSVERDDLARVVDLLREALELLRGEAR